MKLRLVRPGIVALWVVTAGWFLRFEGCPDVFSAPVAGYRHLLDSGVLAQDAWMKIVFRDSPIGYSHTSLNVNESRPEEYCVVDNRTVLNVSIMGEPQKARVQAVAILNRAYELRAGLAWKLSRACTELLGRLRSAGPA